MATEPRVGKRLLLFTSGGRVKESSQKPSSENKKLFSNTALSQTVAPDRTRRSEKLAFHLGERHRPSPLPDRSVTFVGGKVRDVGDSFAIRDDYTYLCQGQNGGDEESRKVTFEEEKPKGESPQLEQSQKFEIILVRSSRPETVTAGTKVPAVPDAAAGGDTAQVRRAARRSTGLQTKLDEYMAVSMRFGASSHGGDGKPIRDEGPGGKERFNTGSHLVKAFMENIRNPLVGTPLFADRAIRSYSKKSRRRVVRLQLNVRGSSIRPFRDTASSSNNPTPKARRPEERFCRTQTLFRGAPSVSAWCNNTARSCRASGKNSVLSQTSRAGSAQRKRLSSVCARAGAEHATQIISRGASVQRPVVRVERRLRIETSRLAAAEVSGRKVLSRTVDTGEEKSAELLQRDSVMRRIRIKVRLGMKGRVERKGVRGCAVQRPSRERDKGVMRVVGAAIYSKMCVRHLL